MVRWNIQQRIFCVENFLKFSSIIQTQRLFRLHFNVRDVPARTVISYWVRKWRNHGSVERRKSTGRIRSACNPENEERVRQSILRSPNRSVRRHAAALNLSATSTRRMLHKMKFHPYKIAVVQKLTDRDKQSRVEFCQRFLELSNEEPDIAQHLFMSDEAHFTLHGLVNKQNFRYWATENPCEIYERPLHSPKVTVWCAVSSSKIIGPYFFEENGETVTVNSQRYAHMLQTFFIPQIEEEERNHFFQQDGATCHTARISMEILRQTFPNRLISRNGDFNWPPRSPDITVPDFFLWGYLKSRVFKSKPRNIEELKRNIRQEIEAIPQDMLQRVMADFVRRLEECVEKGGGHLTHTIFKK